MGEGTGGNEGVLIYIEEIKNLADFQTRDFSKILKNQGNFAIFEIF